MRHLLLLPVLLATALPSSLVAQDDRGVITGATARYQMRPGDVLEIRVWGREDFSGRFQVNEDWVIQYPVIGEINVRDRTVANVREELRDGLEQIFRSPFITVTPLFRMAVLGEVQAAGLYTVDPTLSVLDVVALAGGPSRNGNMNKVRLLRTGDETELSFEREALSGRTLAEIGVRSGDEIVVPRRFFTRDDIIIVLSLVQIVLSVVIIVNTL